MPKGKLTQQKPWESKIFPETKRDWWVYVPAQYKDDQPACVMVFQDGGGYTRLRAHRLRQPDRQGRDARDRRRVHQPRHRAAARTAAASAASSTTRLSDRYARFLLEEILPEVEKTVKLRHDPESRAIAGISSGGICAWTVAWERPDEFRKVLSWVGSFTNIASGKTRREGGHNYEALIRKTPKKPIRVFLQDGANDLDNANGNWPLANQQMAKALAVRRVRLSNSSSARASTATATAAPSCPTRSAGSGATTSRATRRRAASDEYTGTIAGSKTGTAIRQVGLEFPCAFFSFLRTTSKDFAGSGQYSDGGNDATGARGRWTMNSVCCGRWPDTTSRRGRYVQSPRR